MQIPFRTQKKLFPSCLLALLAFPGSATLSRAEGPAPGNPSEMSKFRIIAAKEPQTETYHAGLEIQLEPSALTYWRQPGDAGVPPTFSFEGSDNLRKAEVLYPAPTRIREDEGEAFGYQDKVIFPVLVTPKDPSRSVTLKVTADYAVCERICVPVKARGELLLPASAAGTAENKAMAEAEARVPAVLPAAALADRLEITRQADAEAPTWRLQWKGPLPMADLFAEAPAGWYFETKKAAGNNAFSIVAVDVPGEATQTPVTLTLTSASQNYTFTVPLEIARVGGATDKKQ